MISLIHRISELTIFHDLFAFLFSVPIMYILQRFTNKNHHRKDKCEKMKTHKGKLDAWKNSKDEEFPAPSGTPQQP